MNRVLIAMPAFNESNIIRDVIEDYLNLELDNFKIEILIVDDCSTDNTFEILMNMQQKFPTNIYIFKNPRNQGHGPTYCNALQLAIDKKPEIIFGCDGDGPISASDIAYILESCNNFEVIEISRKNRIEPLFRKIVSQVTRMIVLLKTGSWPEDANTPLRVFRPEILQEMIHLVRESKVPNLLISILTRKRRYLLETFQIDVLERKVNQQGTMWGESLLPRNLPNFRFIKFSVSALKEVIKFDKK